MTRLDWDREVRQARLRKWLADHPLAGQQDDLPPPESLDATDVWARRQVELTARRVRAAARARSQAASSTAGRIADELDQIRDALAREDFSAARRLASNVMTETSSLSPASLDREVKSQVLDTIGLVLAYQ